MIIHMIYSTISMAFQARINANIIDIPTTRRIYELG